MCNLITRDQVEEVDVHKFCSEASTLGWHPGQWPKSMPTTLGNKQPFIASYREERDGDLLWIVYRQALGCISLKVFND